MNINDRIHLILKGLITWTTIFSLDQGTDSKRISDRIYDEAPVSAGWPTKFLPVCR